MPDEDLIDEKADAIVDLAMSHVKVALRERDEIREQLQDAVDALIDACLADRGNHA